MDRTARAGGGGLNLGSFGAPEAISSAINTAKSLFDPRTLMGSTSPGTQPLAGGENAPVKPYGGWANQASQWPPQAPPSAMADGGEIRTKSIKGVIPRLHVGPIPASVAGRTDHLPMHVPSGSYVLPADIVSGIGEGNTLAGFHHLRRVFGGVPYSGASMPYGATGGPYGEPLPHANGGKVEGVPIIAAGGEYVIHPEAVRWVGDGDMDTGHKVLDQWVKDTRASTVKTLKKLPGPAKD